MTPATTLLVGFDSAWTATNRGALAAVVVDGAEHECVRAPQRVTFAEAGDVLHELVAEHRPARVRVAIDQPTIVPNEMGSRPVDRFASRVVGRFRTAVQPASRSRTLMFGDGAPIWAFLDALRALLGDVSLDAADWCAATPSCVVAEVYPVLSLLAFFPETIERREVLRYNPTRKTFRESDWRHLCVGMAAWCRDVGLDALADRCSGLAGARPRKSDQDTLDAVICLRIGHHASMGGGAAMAGDVATGCMLVPDADALAPILDIASTASGVPLATLRG